MAKLLYRKDFLRLLRASEAAEKGYAAFLRDEFQYPASMSLEAMLSDIFQSEVDKTKRAEQVKTLNQINAFKDRPFDQLLYQTLIDKFTDLFQDSKRLDRTVKELTNILNIGQHRKKGEPGDIQSSIAKIIGNYKEHFFLDVGGKEYVSKGKANSRRTLGIEPEILDVDKIEGDFILTDKMQAIIIKPYGHITRKTKNPITYMQGGVLLEHKATLEPQFHWFDKTYDNISLDNIIKNHVKTPKTNWEEDYNNIIIDVTMKAIFEKVNNGFPVFVTKKLYNNETNFILCSTVLKSISDLVGLQTLVIDQSSYGGLTKMRGLTEDYIFKLIKADKEARAYFEQQIKDLRDSGLYSGNELTNKISELQTDEASINLLKSIIKQDKIKLSIFYAKPKNK